MYDLNTPWPEVSFVAFDTETTGAYPIESEIVEFGAAKWEKGQVVDTLQLLFKPRQKMSDFIIGIHGITNEMVENADQLSQHIEKIYNFMQSSVAIAHHAPFDLGFVAPEFERHLGKLPTSAALCSSLLARKLITGTPNHKLQTLAQHFQINSGQAHRALDDAKTCLEVALRCFATVGSQATLQELYKAQEKPLRWDQFTLFKFQSNETLTRLVEACQKKILAEIIYTGGTMKNRTRQIRPIGIVRNPDGDYVMAECLIEKTIKRFYLSKIQEIALIY